MQTDRKILFCRLHVSFSVSRFLSLSLYLSVCVSVPIDIYCCKFFDLEIAKQVCRRFFAPKKIDEQYIERGLDYFKTDTNYHTMTVNKVGTSCEIKIDRKDSEIVV